MNRLACVLAVVVVALAASAAAQHGRTIRIGTGGVTGVYYPAGAAICRQVNRSVRQHGVRCRVESTAGSVANVDRIRDNTLDLGIVQSDVQYAAFYGVREFADKGPFTGLRSVFTLHREPFTLVARPDAGIRSFADLRGKRVNIGNPGSGQRNTMTKLMEALGWTNADFAAASELDSAHQAQALCADEIDAFVFTVGHPSGSITEATRGCGAVLVPVTGDAVDRLVAENAYYSRVVIPGGIYDGNAGDVVTFGGAATLVADASVPDDVVYAVVKAVFDDLPGFTRLHPALARLTAETMLDGGLTAPVHPGALKYFTENGLM